MSPSIPTPPLLSIPIVPTPDIQFLHSNTSRINLNPLEATIHFGNLTELPVGQFSIRDSLVLTLPHVHAKILSVMLATAVEKYEKEFGEIGIPKLFDVENYKNEVEKNMKKIRENF